MIQSTADTRSRLLRTACDLFTRQGYDTVSIREIANAAHVNLGAVTYHFGSKQALYHAAIELLAGPMATLVTSIAASELPPVERVEAVVRGAMDHLLEHPGAATILLRELASDHPLPPPLAQLLRQNLGTLSRIIAEGQADGSFRTGDARLLAITVMSQAFFVRAAGQVIRAATDMDPSAPVHEARITNHVVESVLRSIASNPGATR